MLVRVLRTTIPIGFQGAGKASVLKSSGAYMEVGEQRSQADNAVQTLKGDGYVNSCAVVFA